MSQQTFQNARTNTLAIVALVTSLLGISLAGIICGHVSLSQIGRTGEQGRGMALAGVIIGYVSLAAQALLIITFVGLAASGAMNDYTY